MDFAKTLIELIDHLQDVYWQIEGLVFDPDLKDYLKQETNMESLPVEYVMQKGDAEHGFGGTIYFPTTYPDGDGNKMYLKVTFSG